MIAFTFKYNIFSVKQRERGGGPSNEGQKNAGLVLRLQ